MTPAELFALMDPPLQCGLTQGDCADLQAFLEECGEWPPK